MPRDSNTPVSHSLYQRERILAALAAGPMTAQQLAEKVHLSRSGVQLHLQAMGGHKPRLVHIADYAPAPPRHRRAPMYGVGDKDDAPYPKARAPKGLITVADRYEQILKLLRTRSRTGAELVGAMHLERARIYVLELHAAKKVYIADWHPQPNGGYPAPIYAAGSKPDVPRPPAMTHSQKSARHWAKLKADPHRHGLHLQRSRMRKNPQTWASALFVGMK